MSLSVIAKLFDNLSLQIPTLNFSELQSDLVDNLLHTSFSENGMKLKQVLEEHYQDGIDGFEDVQVDGDKITGVFIDRVSPQLTKKFKFEVTPKSTVYSALDLGENEDFSELDFTTIKKEKNCVKGLSCGASCVPMKADDGSPTQCKRLNSKAAEDLMNDLIVAAKSSKGNAGGRTNDPVNDKKQVKEPTKDTGNVFDDLEMYTNKAPRQKTIPKNAKKDQKPKKEDSQVVKQESVESTITNGIGIAKSLNLTSLDTNLERESVYIKRQLNNLLRTVNQYRVDGKKIPSALIKKGKEWQQRQKEIQSEIDNINDSNHKKIINYLAKNSSVSVKEGNDFVKGINIDKSIENKQQRQDSAKALRDIYVLSGGRINTLSKPEKSSDRAFASEAKKVINTGSGINSKTKKYDSDYQRRIIFHEAAHHIEYSNPDIKKLAGDFIRMKATSQVPVKLKDLTGNPNYRDNEIALPDKFISPYVGKIYDRGTTEVLSMGIEHFSDPKSLAHLRKEDPDHFNFILGVLAKKREK
jgi:hypothetical protein